MIENRINFGQISNDLFNAPVVAFLFLTIEEFNPWSAYDLGAFGENLMLAASDAGLASLPAFEFVKYPDTLRKYLPVPDKDLIGMGIGLGYASDKKVNDFHSSRAPLDEMMNHSIVSTDTGDSFTIISETLPFLIFITRSAIGAIARL